MVEICILFLELLTNEASFSQKYKWCVIRQCLLFIANPQIRWFFELTSAVRYIHSLLLMHGDLKSANVLFVTAADGMHVRLCDFGMEVGSIFSRLQV